MNTLNILDSIQDLGLLIEKYDKADRESDIALFSEKDLLKNIKQGLADKLHQSTDKPLRECQKSAEEIVDSIQKELDKPAIKERVCASLRLLSGDLSNLSIGVVSAVLATLITGGLITLPMLPALPGMAVAVGSFVLTRAGIEFVCSEIS